MPTIAEFVNVAEALGLGWSIRDTHGNTLCASYWDYEIIDEFLDEHATTETRSCYLQSGRVAVANVWKEES